MFAQTNRLFRPPFQRWRTTRSGAGTGRAALYSPFLLLAFLCGYLAKEKRLKAFGINTPKTLFLLKQEAQKKKLCKKKMPFFALTPRGRSLLKKRRKTTAQSQCEHLVKSKFEIQYIIFLTFLSTISTLIYEKKKIIKLKGGIKNEKILFENNDALPCFFGFCTCYARICKGILLVLQAQQ
jgi:hypothetical protein